MVNKMKKIALFGIIMLLLMSSALATQDYELRYVQRFDIDYTVRDDMQYDDEPYGIAADEEFIYYGLINNTNGYWLEGFLRFDKNNGEFADELLLGEQLEDNASRHYAILDIAYYQGKYYSNWWNDWTPYQGFIRVHDEEFNLLEQNNYTGTGVPTQLAQGYAAQISVNNDVIYILEYLKNVVHKIDIETYDYLGNITLEGVVDHYYSGTAYSNYTSDMCVIDDKIISFWGLTSNLSINDLETGAFIGETSVPAEIENASSLVLKGLGCTQNMVYVALSVNDDYDGDEGKVIHQYVYVPINPSSSSGSKTSYAVDNEGNIVGVAQGNNYLPLDNKEAPFLSLTGGEGFDAKAWFSNLIANIKGWFVK
jgi:hypothetical protein